MKRIAVVGGLLVAALLVTAAPASANLVVDMRFADGTTSMSHAAAGSDIVLQVFAKVFGTNPTSDEMLQFLDGAVKSVQTGGGYMTSGGVTSVSYDQVFSQGNNVTVKSNLSVDGVDDWGNPASASAAMNPRAGAAPVSTGGVPITDPTFGTGVQWHVADVMVHVGTLGTGETAFTWVVPTFTLGSWAGLQQDGGTTFTISNGGTGLGAKTNFVLGSSTAFTPEPATLALMGLGLVGSLIRRRRAA